MLATCKSLLDLYGMKWGCLPFVYLGGPLFSGAPIVFHLRPIANRRIMGQLEAQKGHLLSFRGRLCLMVSHLRPIAYRILG